VGDLSELEQPTRATKQRAKKRRHVGRRVYSRARHLLSPSPCRFAAAESRWRPSSASRAQLRDQNFRNENRRKSVDWRFLLLPVGLSFGILHWGRVEVLHCTTVLSAASAVRQLEKCRQIMLEPLQTSWAPPLQLQRWGPAESMATSMQMAIL
jgi:hypothetical protein